MAEEASRSTVPNIPKARYILIDHQTKSVDGTTHKADGVFYYSNRIEYNMSAVHMFVEAKLVPNPGNLPAETLDRFGHFCDVDTGFPNMRFDRLDPNKKQAYATLVSPEDSDALTLKKRIPRRVNLRSRLAYLFDTICRSKRAVLKLSWTPVKRLPEGAVYEVLHRSGISGIPEVYDTELIREDFYGYRLEYIILEHCGDSIEAYIRDSRNRRDTESEIHINVEQFINQVTNDIESLFYVIIRAFSTSDDCCGFRYYDNENLAFTRVGILGCTGNYLKHFSAGINVGDFKQTLDAMHRYLFYSGDRYIGHDLVSNEDYERLPDLVMAAKFMDKKSVSALQKLFPTNNNEAEVGSKRRRREST
ncbi:hypothetical protein EV177_005165 [Coemansia sp. RSA 1804]|nr:hypothetical protein EV177_005165 [Coemansia sp. RSA 1804]